MLLNKLYLVSSTLVNNYNDPLVIEFIQLVGVVKPAPPWKHVSW